MEAVITLLFFVVLWGAAKGLKVLGRTNPELRALSDALSRGEAKGGEEPPTKPTPGQEAQQPTTKPAP